jgi:hypothetical protein
VDHQFERIAMTSNPSTGTSTQTFDTGGAPPTNEDEGAVHAAVSRVASEAPAQAAHVVQDARSQLTGAAQRTLSDLRVQADDRGAQAARGLRDLSFKVDALAHGRPEEAGNLTDIVQSVGQHAVDFADRLDAGGVQGLADDVARFGRRHPWAFLGLSLGAGFVVGRLARTTAEVANDARSDQEYALSSVPSVPSVSPVPPVSPGAATLSTPPAPTTTFDGGTGFSTPGARP